MKRSALIAVFVAVFAYGGAVAQTFLVKADFGTVQVFQGAKGVRSAVADTATIIMGDSILLDAASQATVTLEENSRLIFRGPGALTMAGDATTAYLSFDKGHLFLDRNQPALFSILTFWVKNYMFVPAGTAATFRVMDNGMPFVAVTNGRVLMQSPTGESVEVTAGRFSLVDPSGRITNGTLGSRIIDAFKEWSGVAPAQAGSAPKNSSNAAVDDEIVSSLARRPAASAVRPKPAAQPSKSSGDPVVATPARKKEPARVESARKEVPRSPEQEPEADGSSQKPRKDSAAAEKPENRPPDKPRGEISAGSVTVGEEQWTRLSVGVDVPIWKFGVFFDIEAFIDPSGGFSDKGWRFNDDVDYVEAVSRKIRYIRFGHEQDPVFVKFGGISDVTLGHGFIVDRFSNMLHYPDQKLVGGQIYLNDITPAGLTLQAFGADALELRERDRGGLGAARLAFRPLKMTGIPVAGGISVGGTYAYDRNLYAPARGWNRSAADRLIATFDDRGLLADSAITAALRDAGFDPEGTVSRIAAEEDAKNRFASFGIFGGDITVPVIATSLLSLDVYAQAAMRHDSILGWGIGAPGVALKVWRLSGSLEYRRICGQFTPGFFGPYYLDERLVRNPEIRTKAESLPDDTLNGAFGRIGFDVFSVLTMNGSYQYMVGSERNNRDQRYELSAELGSMITERIPKLRSAEGYLYKTRVGTTIAKYDSAGTPALRDGLPVYDRPFEKTPFMYYGYRIGIEISEGATLVWDSRIGWLRDDRGRLVPNNNITIQTAISF